MKQLASKAIVIAATLSVGVSAFGYPSPNIDDLDSGLPLTWASIPPGFNQSIVFIADGEVSAAVGFLLFGDDSFYTDTLGFTPDEIAAEEAAAVSTFDSRFGVPNADDNPDVALDIYNVDSDINYRAYVFGGARVPRTGWKVHDGGFLLTVVNPNGITLGGDFAGVHAPAGTALAYGTYSIERTTLGGQPLPPLRIDYESAAPSFPATQPGGVVLNCQVTNDDFGAGLAQGFVGFTDVGDGLINANVRNVITFSDEGGL